jgi:hypothetical protein
MGGDWEWVPVVSFYYYYYLFIYYFILFHLLFSFHLFL